MKVFRVIAIVLLICFMIQNTGFAFTFPEPDWGALLSEKTRMVKTDELELYTEGNVESAPYYGAKLEPRSGTYIGMITENSADFAPVGSYLTYIQEMAQDDFYHPANVMISEGNSVVMVGWTINDLYSVDYNQVRRVLDNISRYNKPTIIRFANEMNVSSIGNDPNKYIEVFRNVANMVHEYPNFATVWSPNDMGALDRPFEYYYPGDEYVDWVGISSYMKKYFQGRETIEKEAIYFMTGDYAWATNAVKPIIKFMEENNIQKPLMISEGGVATSNKKGENVGWWAEPRLKNMLWYLPMIYPQIKMINIFNTHRPNEAERFDISNYQYAADIFKEASDNGVYLRSATDTPGFTFVPAKNGETLNGENGIVNLYSFVYHTKTPDVTVTYRIDGNWYHSVNQIPYICRLDISNLTDGEHTVKISTDRMEKTYLFYKNGNSIRFGGEPEKIATEEITVRINGKKIEFDQPPIMKNDRTLVPLRKIFEELGATVEWNDRLQKVTAVKDDIKVMLTIGDDKLYINNGYITLDVPAQLVNGRTLVPVRAVSESFNCNVNWDDNTQTVMIVN